MLRVEKGRVAARTNRVARWTNGRTKMPPVTTSPSERVLDRNANIELDEHRFRLRDIDWQTYRTISQALAGRHVRLAYNRGTLEFMTIWHLHGNYSGLLGRFVVVLTEELQMTIRSCRDMTLDREDLERG